MLIGWAIVLLAVCEVAIGVYVYVVSRRIQLLNKVVAALMQSVAADMLARVTGAEPVGYDLKSEGVDRWN